MFKFYIFCFQVVPYHQYFNNYRNMGIYDYFLNQENRLRASTWLFTTGFSDPCTCVDDPIGIIWLVVYHIWQQMLSKHVVTSLHILFGFIMDYGDVITWLDNICCHMWHTTSHMIYIGSSMRARRALKPVVNNPVEYSYTFKSEVMNLCINISNLTCSHFLWASVCILKIINPFVCIELKYTITGNKFLVSPLKKFRKLLLVVDGFIMFCFLFCMQNVR